MAASGEPDLRLEGMSLWVHGREFPDSMDFWDGNWLDVTAIVQAGGARVEVRGPLIRNAEVAAFAESLKTLCADLGGKAELSCLEPGLHIGLRGDGLGHIAIGIRITPDQLAQSHSFEFVTDQTFLPPLIAACETLLVKYPVRGSPSD